MNFNSGCYVERFLIAAGVALAVPLTAVAFGAPHGAPNGCGGAELHGKAGHRGMLGETMPPYLRGLDLTEAQRDKVFEILHAQAPEMRDRAKAMHRVEDELRGLVAAPDYSAAKAKALADSAAKAMAEMTLARVATDRQVFEVLTPEQRKQAAEIKADDRRGLEGEGRPSSGRR